MVPPHSVDEGFQFTFSVTNRTWRGSAGEGVMPDQRFVLTVGGAETILSVLRRAGVDTSQSPLWQTLLAGNEAEDHLNLWLVDAQQLLRLRELDPGVCILPPSLTVKELVDYFGEGLIRGKYELTFFPAEGIGGHLGEGWVDLARNAGVALSGLSPIEMLRAALELYGAVGVLLTIRRSFGKFRARPIRRYVHRWVSTGEMSRRLRSFIRRRRSWNVLTVADRFDIDHQSAAAMLRESGFALCRSDYQTWTRVSEE